MSDNQITVGEMNMKLTNHRQDGTTSVGTRHTRNVDLTDAMRMQAAGCPDVWVKQAFMDAMRQTGNLVVERLK